jgi:hypothetical protein
MPKLYDTQSGTFLGNVSDVDIQFLVEQLEEEHGADEDYFIDTSAIELLEEAGGSAVLIGVLRKAVGDSEGIEVRYEK